jgi:hypothetical protein
MGDLSDLIANVRIATAQHRRLVAAACAGLATLLFVSTIAAGSTSPTSPGTPEAIVESLGVSEVAVPILLADKQLASAVQLGNSVQLIQLFDGSEPEVISDNARVMSKGSASNAFSTGDASLIVVAVPREESVQVAAAGASASLTLVVKSAHS